MTETKTTSNGHEIAHPVEILSAESFRRSMAEEYGFDGETPGKRIERLKDMSVEGVAILLEGINKSVQGSRDSLMNHESVMLIGDKATLKPEDRYEVFLRLVEDVRACPDNVNPARIGDVLALGVVLLHPFHDGNGRTARTIGLLFRDDYDGPDYESDYNTVIEPRDVARARKGFLISGYIPQMPEGQSRSNPEHVSQYLHTLLHEENENSYMSCFGQAPLLETNATA